MSRKKKTNVNENKEIEIQLQYYTYSVESWTTRPALVEEKRRESGPVKLSNLRYALCVLSLSHLFFSFCIYAYLCVFSTAGALEVITV